MTSDRPASQAPTSRYGGFGKQPSFLAVAKMIDDNKTEHLADAARLLGFDGVLIEKQPFQESEWRALAANIGANTCNVFEDDRRILYALRLCR